MTGAVVGFALSSRRCPSVDDLIADAIKWAAAGGADAARWLMAHGSCCTFD